MSNKETKEHENTPSEAVKMAAETNDTTTPVVVDEKAEEDSPSAPEPVATGNDQVAILKHDLYRKDSDDKEAIAIGLKIKNASDAIIGSVLFEAELYDIEGKTLGTVEKKTIDLKPGSTRTIRLEYSGPDSDKVRSYCAKVAGMTTPPQPEVTGNESIEILKHSLNIGFKHELGNMSSASITIRNVSQITAASIIFEATFYDIEGNVMDTIKHREIDLKPGNSRAITIQLDKPGIEKFKSYNIRIARMTTADVEKVQIRRHEMKTVGNGEEEVRGVIKNVSNEKADAALAASFFDDKKENIGTRVIILRDIAPDDVKQFHITFKPIEGDKIKSYNLNIGDLVE